MVGQHQMGDIAGFAVWLPTRSFSRTVTWMSIYAELICKEPHMSSC